MSLYFKMHILGLHILVFIHLAQSFVLLTANMADVKKLARKFVSESLAEQIAEFITKISTGAINVSEENEKNLDDFQEESSEKWERIDLGNQTDNTQYRQEKNKKARPRPSHETLKRKKHSTIRHPTTRKFITSKWPQYNLNREEVEKKESMETYNKQQWHKKLRNKLSGKMSDENDTPKIHLSLNDNTQSSAFGNGEDLLQFHLDTRVDKDNTGLQSRLQYERPNKYIHNAAQNLQNNVDKSHQPSTVYSTIGYAEIIAPSGSNPGSDQLRYDVQDEVIRAHKDGLDIEHKSATYPIYTVYDKDIILTTRKEKNEFDQYDNMKYPKLEYVATSGPVALPKLPPEISDKDSSDLDTSLNRRQQRKDKKAWF